MNARENAFNILMTFEKIGQRLEIITSKELLKSKSSEKERKFIYNLTDCWAFISPVIDYQIFVLKLNFSVCCLLISQTLNRIIRRSSNRLRTHSKPCDN